MFTEISHEYTKLFSHSICFCSYTFVQNTCKDTTNFSYNQIYLKIVVKKLCIRGLIKICCQQRKTTKRLSFFAKIALLTYGFSGDSIDIIDFNLII